MEHPVFICDDDSEQINQTTKILGLAEMILSDEEEVRFNIASAKTYQGAVNFLQNNQFDGGLYFLDVELGKEVNDENGFDLADFIKKNDERAQIIFVTSHADLSIITYRRRLGPVDYIVKTDKFNEYKKRVIKTVEIALYQLTKMNYLKEMTFSYRIGSRIINVDLKSVMYITTTLTPHKLLLVRNNGEAQFIGSINEYANNNPMLEKISQSCLANPQNIEEIDLKNRLVTFKNGDVEEFSRPSTKKIKELLNKFNYKVGKIQSNK